jgi:hypothetical protein
MAKQVFTKAYLYSRWRGRFEVNEGYVRPAAYSVGHAVFEIDGPKSKRRQCSTEPGVVCNGAVWLTERDDDQARKIFTEYEWKCIAELQERIRHHLWNIECLKGNAHEKAT